MRIRPIHALITAMSIMVLAACGTPTAVDSVNSVTINEGDQTVIVGATFDYSVTVDVTGAADNSVTWSSGNTTVATVDADGVVTAVAAGTAEITATSVADSSVFDTVTVTVPGQAVNDVTINEGNQTIDVGATFDFSVTVTAQGGASEAVTWTSDTPSVATVDSTGQVTGVAEGTATITAESDFDDTKFDTVTVTVLAAADLNNIFVDDDATAPYNGSSAHPFPTVQEGVAAVNAGGTVNIATGVYTAAVSIDKSVTLLGAKSDSLVDRGIGESQLSGKITISGDGISVAINGIRFRYGAAPSLESSGVDHTISITYTLFDGSIRQLFLNDPISVTFENNIANVQNQASGGFLWISGDWDGTVGTSVSVQNNDFTFTFADGSPAINASSVTGTIANNQIDMTAAADGQDNSRIALLLAGTTSDLNVQGNTLSNANQGIRFFQISADGLGPVTIDANAITNVRYGVDVDSGGLLSGVSVTNNTFTNAVDSIVLGQDGVSITSNAFEGASNAYVLEEGGAYDLNSILASNGNTFTPPAEVGTAGGFDAIVEQTPVP